MLSIFKQDPAELLRTATAKKKRGDIDGAIECLRKAYKAIAKSSVNYGPEPYLRLPAYLQAAGRNDEAWAEFNGLIIAGYPNQMWTRELLPMDHSRVYDKMRLFLQREKQPVKAVKFGVFCHLSWGQGLHYQGRTDELSNHTSKGALEISLRSLLTKAERRSEIGSLLQVIEKHLKDFPDLQYAALGQEIDQLLTRK